MSLTNVKLSRDAYDSERRQIINTWPTGPEADFDEGVARQSALPEHKRFSKVLATAHLNAETLLQPRAGVALLR